jgi:hypothetical protein
LDRALTWSGGDLNFDLTVASNGVLSISGSASKQLSGVVSNAGRIDWTGSGYLEFVEDASGQLPGLVNLAGGLVDIETDADVVEYYSSGSALKEILNYGTVRKSGGSGSTTFYVPFTNGGVLEARIGTLSFNSTASLTTGSVNIGFFSQTNFGRVTFSGAAALAGSLSATLLDGSVPPVGASFRVITFPSRTGEFANYAGLLVGYGRYFEPLLTPTNVTLLARATNYFNHAPVLDPIANCVVNEGTFLTFTNRATDVDNDTLTFSLVNAPACASVHPTTGVFTWIPTEAEGPGFYTITVRVTDNGVPNLSHSQTFTVTVNEDNGPRFVIGGSTRFVDGKFQMQITATVGRTIIIYASTNLTFWLPIATNVVPSSGEIILVDPTSASLSQRFTARSCREKRLPNGHWESLHPPNGLLRPLQAVKSAVP